MKNVVRCRITLEGGKALTWQEEGRVTEHVHDTLADEKLLRKKYGREGYAIVVEIAE